MSELNAFLEQQNYSRRQKLLRKSILKSAAKMVAAQLITFIERQQEQQRKKVSDPNFVSHSRKDTIMYYTVVIGAYKAEFANTIATLRDELFDELNIYDYPVRDYFSIESQTQEPDHIFYRLQEVSKIFTDLAEKLNVPSFDLSVESKSDVSKLKEEVSRLIEEIMKALEDGKRRIQVRNSTPGRLGRMSDLMLDSGDFRDSYRPFKNQVNELRDRIIEEANIPKETVNYNAFEITSAENDPGLVEQNINSAVNELRRLSEQLKN